MVNMDNAPMVRCYGRLVISKLLAKGGCYGGENSVLLHRLRPGEPEMGRQVPRVWGVEHHGGGAGC